jgi:hypothetical protein
MPIYHLLGFILSLLCVCLVLLCITNKYCSAQNKQQRTNIHELLDIAETNSTLSRPWTGNKISGNPIYEAVQFSELQALDVDLPSISRQSLKLERFLFKMSKIFDPI